HCILWHAEISASPGWDDPYRASIENFLWDINVQDESAALRVLPLDVPPGGTFWHAWRESQNRDDQLSMNDVSMAALQGGDRYYSQEIRCVDRGGQLHWLREDVSIQPLQYGSWRAFGVVTDV